MGLMKSQAILHYGKEQEPSVALGSIPINKALPRENMGIYVAGTKTAWAHIIINRNGKFLERAGYWDYQTSDFARRDSLIAAINILSDPDIVGKVVVPTKHKKLADLIYYRGIEYGRHDIEAKIIAEDDHTHDYWLARVEYLLDHPDKCVSTFFVVHQDNEVPMESA